MPDWCNGNTPAFQAGIAGSTPVSGSHKFKRKCTLMLKLGSLFDGSGGFPLAGALNGIKPVWASEIEPYPIRVTKARFPNMKHLGSVLNVNGTEIEPVDIITFGSPCQDLSVAGKQLGIHVGERSNLFFEAIRIIKEMRNATSGKYPRFAVWENVPGAFSSNKGADFQAVLQAFYNLCGQENISIPAPPKRKWSRAGCIVGDGYSIAWRVYDAQYWGVPQRRKRIYLVADFASERAGEILFERESLCGNPAEGGESWDGTARDDEGSTGGGCDAGTGHEGTCIAFHLQQDPISGDVSPCIGGQHQASVGVGLDLYNFSVSGDKAVTLNASSGSSASHAGPTVCSAVESNTIDCQSSKNGKGYCESVSPTLTTRGRHGVCYAPNGNHCGHYNKEAEASATLQTRYHYGSGGDAAIVVYDCRGNGDGKHVPTLTGDHQNRVSDYTALCVGNGQMCNISMAPVSNTLDCMHDQQAVLMEGRPPRKYIVRRLTPLECCRLQGFPDWWEQGIEGKDSARYKMWGNGIALPCACDVLRRIAQNA